MEWKNITIATFQDLCKELDEEYPDETEKTIGLLSVITGKPIYHYTNEVKVGELLKLLEGLNFLKTDIPKLKLKSNQWVGKRRFRFDLNIRNAGKYIGFSKLVEDPNKVNDNLHLIMATLCYEVNWFGFKKESDFKERSEYLQNNMSIVYAKNLSAFFLSNYQKLIVATESYLESEKAKMVERSKEAIDRALSSIGDGISH